MEVRVVKKALKNVLYGVMIDLSKMKVINAYSYELKNEDFEGIGSDIWILCKKYALRTGFTRITLKMLESKGITKEQVTEYFSDIDGELEENFELYLTEIQSMKLLNEFKVLNQTLLSQSKRIKGENIEEKANQFAELVKTTSNMIKPLKRSVTYKDLIDLHNEAKNPYGEFQTIKSGIKDVDSLIGGWKRKGINILTGLSNQGKTTFINQCLVYASAVLGLKVLLINLEIEDNDVYAKAMGLISNMGYQSHSLTNFDLKTEEGKDALQNRLKEDEKLLKKYYQYGSGKFSVYSGSITDEELVRVIQEADSDDYDIVAVDYFQLVEIVDKKGKSKAERLSNLAEIVKNEVRRTKKMAFVWLAQLNEESDKKPMEYEIAWCKDLKKSADSEIRVWREYLDKKSRTFLPNMRVGFPKLRFRERTEPLNLGFDGVVGRIEGFHKFDNTFNENEIKENENFQFDLSKHKDELDSILVESYSIQDWIAQKQKEEREFDPFETGDTPFDEK